jgi:hypothetical protein
MSMPFKNEAVISYLPAMSNCNTPSKTMMEVIQIVSAHTADVLVSIMNILSKKYGHAVDEMMEVVRTNPEFHAIQIHPILTTEFFNRPAAVSHIPLAAPAPVPVPILQPKKVIKIVKKGTKIIAPVSPTTSTPPISPLQIDTNVESPKTASPTSPLSEIIVIETPPASVVIDMSNAQVAQKKAPVIKRKAAAATEPSMEADKKDVKPHTY